MISIAPIVRVETTSTSSAVVSDASTSMRNSRTNGIE
jgi:hypothetical protein